MAEPNQQHQQQAPAAEQGAASTPQTTPAAPGLAAVKAVAGSGASAAEQVVKILHGHPDERDTVMEWLHQNRGNAFVQEVTGKMGQVERAMPAGYDLKSVTGSISIPGHRKLAGNWKASVATSEPTQLTVEVSHTGIRVWLAPSLFVDATWPLQNCNIEGAGITFADGKAHAQVEDGHGLGSGMWSIKDNVAGMITDILSKGVAHSPLGKPGYEPTQDANLAGTLQSVITGFESMFTNEEHDASKQPPIKPEEMKDISAGATVTAKAGGNFVKDGSGLLVDAGSDITLSLLGAGNAKDAMAANGMQSAVEAAHIRSLQVSAGGLEVIAGGKPIAKLESLSLAPGGKVTIDQMTLLGKAAEARAMESGLSLLVTLLAVESHDPAANGAYQNANDPKLVDGVTRSLIEQTFTDTVHKLVLQYRGAIPNFDLANALKIS